MPAPETRLDGAAEPARGAALLSSAFGASVALAVLAATESVVNPVALGLAPAPIAAVVGACIGTALAFVRRLLLRRSRAAQVAAWCSIGAVAGLWPGLAIGSIAKLHGPHHSLALATLIGTPAAGVLVGGVVSLGQPGRAGGAPIARTPWLVASVVAALTAAIGTEVCDETLLVLRGYPPIRAAIFGSACLLAAHAGVALGSWVRFPGLAPAASRAVMATWAVCVASGVVADARLSPERVGPLLSRPLAGRFFALARTTTDVDGDGSSSLFGGGDCAPFDARVNPHAREIPGNGIDDNCRWGDAKPRPRATAPQVTAADAAPPAVDVVLITIDTLRADHVGSYGYPRRTTPNIDAFGGTALRFSHAYTSGGWTCLAVNSMLTGLYPRMLDWEPVAITTKERIVPFPWKKQLVEGEGWLNTLSAPVKMPAPPLPSLLRARGIRTAAVVASMPGSMLDYRHVLEQSFERLTLTAPGSDDSKVADAALERLSSFDGAPFFLWVHFFEPHEPYANHAEVPRFGDALIDRYDHDVAFSDYQTGRLISAIDARNGRPTAVIVASDHGEVFQGGAPVHGEDLHEESIHIPLFVRGPGITAGVSDAYVSLVDIAPTILEWTATKSSGLDGVSLLHPVAGRAVITDIWRHDVDGKVFIDLVGVTSGDERLVRDQLSETWTMFAAHDMSRPLRPSGAAVDERLRAVLGHYLESAGTLE